MSRTDYGSVELEIGDLTVTLEPTLKALKRINKQYGSLRAAGSRVAAMDCEAVTNVIMMGATLPQRERDAIEQRVFDAGLIKITGPVSSYLLMLMNPAGNDQGAEDDEEEVTTEKK